MNVIECHNLSKTYGSIKALNNLSFSIKENTITGLIGRNGAGKTTLLKTIAGYFRKSAGEVTVFGEDPFNSLKVSSNMIFVDDKMTYPSALKLPQILEVASTFYENWDQELAQGLFDYFSLNPKQSHQNLSKGMKSTFNMIVALAARCPLTILDEPTTGMDSAVRKDFYRALLKDYLQNPRTILLSSHLLNEIDDILEDVLLMRDGEKRLHLSVEELKEYAIGLKGHRERLETWTNGKDVLFEESIGKKDAYFVVKNDYGPAALEELTVSGIETSRVATDDLCVYLTAKTKGGIDHVFKRS